MACDIERAVAASHSIVWEASNRARREAEKAYQVFLGTASAGRVSVRPRSYLIKALFVQIVKIKLFVHTKIIGDLG